MPWKVDIIDGYASDLEQALARLSGEGWAVRFVLPNGVNRWTVITERASEGVGP